MIEVKITIPSDELGDPNAVSRRMAVLGYVPTEMMWKPAGSVVQVAQPDDPAPVAVVEPAKPEPVRRGRPKKAEPAPEPEPNISAQPEQRVDPEVEAQDDEDEAAEVVEAAVLTAEDLRSMMGRYVNTFGLAEAQADGPRLFADALGTPPEGASIWSVTLASKSQDTLVKAIAAWETAVKNGKRYGT